MSEEFENSYDTTGMQYGRNARIEGEMYDDSNQGLTVVGDERVVAHQIRQDRLARLAAMSDQQLAMLADRAVVRQSEGPAPKIRFTNYFLPIGGEPVMILPPNNMRVSARVYFEPLDNSASSASIALSAEASNLLGQQRPYPNTYEMRLNTGLNVYPQEISLDTSDVVWARAIAGSGVTYVAYVLERILQG
jgi:hypothetical protein